MFWRYSMFSNGATRFRAEWNVRGFALIFENLIYSALLLEFLGRAATYRNITNTFGAKILFILKPSTLHVSSFEMFLGCMKFHSGIRLWITGGRVPLTHWLSTVNVSETLYALNEVEGISWCGIVYTWHVAKSSVLLSDCCSQLGCRVVLCPSCVWLLLHRHTIC